MCEFKYCEGPQACFLRDISPCPGACQPEIAAPVPSNKNHGFIDREDMIQSLDAVKADAALGTQLAQLRVSSKVLRAIQVLGQQKAS